MTDIAMGIILGFLKGIPALIQDIQNNSKLSAEEKKKYVEQLAGEVHDVSVQIAAYRFKDV